MSDIKPNVKETVTVFTQVVVGEIVKESTRKLIKNLTSRQKKLLEARVKNLSDDQLEQYFDKDPYFKNKLENTVKSVNRFKSAGISEQWLENLQSLCETFCIKNLIMSLILQQLTKKVLAVIFIALLAIFIIPEPDVNFSSNVSGLSVQFTDQSAYATRWMWDFGDSTNLTERNPMRNYSAAGSYTVYLTASNFIHKRSTSAIITVPEQPDYPEHVYAYITDTGSNTVSVVDTATNRVTATVPAGSSPYGVAVSPDGTKVYVTNSGSVYSINPANNYSDVMSIGIWPVRFSSKYNVSLIDTATNRITNTVDVGKGP